MITFITGAPGEGKTAFLVNEILEYRNNADNIWRPIFVHGIPGLKIPHTVIKCRNDACEVCPPDKHDHPDMKEVESWHEWAPQGSIMLVDECHYPFPETLGKEHPAIAAITTHRKKGIDFWFLTQALVQTHTKLRHNANKHTHLFSKSLRRIRREWGYCNTSFQTLGDGTEHTYKLPKHVFGLYKSASLHTKIKRSLPKQIYTIAACILLIGILGFRQYGKLNEQISKAVPEQQTVSNSIPDTSANLPSSTSNLSPSQSKPLNFDYEPKIPNIPESAPIYSELVHVKTFPQLKGCIQNKKTTECKCYTQQGTLYDVSFDMCSAYIKYGRFNPYREEMTQQAQTVGGSSGLPDGSPSVEHNGIDEPKA